jgi:MYXO-CTERM domain-containing protein
MISSIMIVTGVGIMGLAVLVLLVMLFSGRRRR